MFGSRSQTKSNSKILKRNDSGTWFPFVKLLTVPVNSTAIYKNGIIRDFVTSLGLTALTRATNAAFAHRYELPVYIKNWEVGGEPDFSFGLGLF
jgi:hypothetical protein